MTARKRSLRKLDTEFYRPGWCPCGKRSVLTNVYCSEECLKDFQGLAHIVSREGGKRSATTISRAVELGNAASEGSHCHIPARLNWYWLDDFERSFKNVMGLGLANTTKRRKT